MPNILWVLVVVLLILAVVGAPAMGLWTSNWGYGPSGLALIIVIILLVVLLR